MRFSANPGVLAAGVPTSKTYADWVAHISARTVNVIAWGGATNPNTGENSYRTTATSDVGIRPMYGSPWGAGTNRVQLGSSISRIIQHGMASEADFSSQVSNLSAIIITAYGRGSYAGFFGVDRNGYLSLDDGAETGFLVSEVSYWDHSSGKPKTMNPAASSGPVDYVFLGW